MSHEQDKELQDFLEGKSPVNKLYQQGEQTRVPAHLDELIINQAHEAVKPRSHTSPFSTRWFVPASAAALLVLSISILYQMPGSMSPQPVTSKEKPAELADVAPQTDTLNKQAEPSVSKPMPAKHERLAERSDVEEKPLTEMEVQTFASAPAMMPAPTEMVEEKKMDLAADQAASVSIQARQMEANSAVGVSAENKPAWITWLDKIQKLVDAAQYEQAQQELAKFTKQYPDYKSKQLDSIRQQLAEKNKP